ncbi:MAG TPA: leucyl/phenylalanyl-tRNA--protein transferase [Spirochaetales bacterium]|nr:leucyl/phenylalanyl-tRNA--protein transferase [Spirochaetales bacterium]
MRRRRREDPAFPRLGPEESFPFPDPRSADQSGIVCSGGNLSPGLLLSAYSQGIFPWFSDNEPLLWWSPDPRFVLFPGRLHVSDTMRKLMRRFQAGKLPPGSAAAAEALCGPAEEAATADSTMAALGGAGAAAPAAAAPSPGGAPPALPGLELSLDRDFPAVIRACSGARRPGQRGTWITEDMIEAYIELHELGYAHSAEARLGGVLVGGLYGVSLGSAFFGESMFSLVPDASKAAFIPLVLRLREEGFTLVDSQVYTDHLAGLGAEEIPREEYLRLLAAALAAPTRRGDWSSLFPGFPASAEYRRLVPEVRP